MSSGAPLSASPAARGRQALRQAPQVAILGPGDTWHTRELLAAFTRRGIAACAVGFERLVATLGRTGPAGTLLHPSEPDRPSSRRRDAALTPPFDLMAVSAVLVRAIPAGSLEQVVFRMDALHRLHHAGVRVVNPPAAIEACVDKYLATARLQAAGLPVPATVVCESAVDALAAFAALGGDVVLKPIFGSDGRGLCRLSDPEVAARVIHALVQTQAILYLQEYIDHPGYDYRVFVIGGDVVASMRRRSGSDFRTNVAQGGQAEPCILEPAWADLARRAAAAVGAEVAGVDLLPTREGDMMVLEVNSAPGFRALTAATGIEIADLVAAYMATLLQG